MNCGDGGRDDGEDGVWARSGQGVYILKAKLHILKAKLHILTYSLLLLYPVSKRYILIRIQTHAYIYIYT